MTVTRCPPHRYLALAVDGPDAATFLQGQLTQDVLQTPAQALLSGAVLNAQGRVLATPWIAFAGERRTLLVPAALAEGLLQHLRRFVLRAKLSFALAAPDPALCAALEATLAARPGADGRGDWSLALVRAGLAEIDVATSGLWIPQMLNLDRVDAISFRKGCYTGQEIVARTQHLGRIKRRMQRLRVPGAPPAPGTALAAGASKVGEVVLAAADGEHAELLAVISLDAPGEPLTLPDGRVGERATLPYPLE